MLNLLIYNSVTQDTYSATIRGICPLFTNGQISSQITFLYYRNSLVVRLARSVQWSDWFRRCLSTTRLLQDILFIRERLFQWSVQWAGWLRKAVPSDRYVLFYAIKGKGSCRSEGHFQHIGVNFQHIGVK